MLYSGSFSSEKWESGGERSDIIYGPTGDAAVNSATSRGWCGRLQRHIGLADQYEVEFIDLPSKGDN